MFPVNGNLCIETMQMNKIHTKYGVAKINDDGYYTISSSKEGYNRKLLHRLLFEDFYEFKIPKGFVIHHKKWK